MANHSLEGARSHALIAAEQLRAVYAHRFACDLEGEWYAWLHVTIRREAMLRRFQRQGQRHPVWSRMSPQAKAVARETLVLILKNERPLAAFNEDLLAARRFPGRPFTADLMIWINGHEDTLLSPLEQQTARLEDAALLLLCATLGALVRQAYAQLETLARVLEDRPNGRMLRGLSRHFHLRAVEETFHEHVFHEMASWVSRSHAEAGATRRVCAERLARLLPRNASALGAAGIVTDGGLAKLFTRYRLPPVER